MTSTETKNRLLELFVLTFKSENVKKEYKNELSPMQILNSIPNGSTVEVTADNPIFDKIEIPVLSFSNPSARGFTGAVLKVDILNDGLKFYNYFSTRKVTGFDLNDSEILTDLVKTFELKRKGN